MRSLPCNIEMTIVTWLLAGDQNKHKSISYYRNDELNR